MNAIKYVFKSLMLVLLVSVMICYCSLSAIAAEESAGANSFDENCAECHSIAKPVKNKKGPSLLGVVGRQSGSVTGYEYSEAMKAANKIWTQENLDAYLTNPKLFIPNDKMKFKGIANKEERKSLIEFLSLQQ